MRKIAILQSNYIPWKGYFDLIASVDEFIIYDDMQFTKRDWRNRNMIKTHNGLKWLSIPVGKDIDRCIRDVVVVDSKWQKKHWNSLVANYSRAKYFKEICNWLEPIYRQEAHTNLSQINRRFIEAICKFLEIKTAITNSWDYDLVEGKTERLADLCFKAGGAEYVSGPAAKDYINEEIFIEKGIKLTWFDYDGYPAYPQQWGKFIHHVTILDLLFNCGKDAPFFMKFHENRKG